MLRLHNATLLFCLLLAANFPMLNTKTKPTLQLDSTRGWPDMFWLKSLQVATEGMLKNSIANADYTQSAAVFAEIIAGLDDIFSKHLKTLLEIEEQLKASSFECLVFCDRESGSLQDWLDCLCQKLQQLRAKQLELLQSHNQTPEDESQWHHQLTKIQLGTRKNFVVSFAQLSSVWAGIVPELLCEQTSFNHNLFLAREEETVVSLPDFLQQLPQLQQELEAIVCQNFRSATQPASKAARLAFYDFCAKISSNVRNFDATGLHALTDVQYQQIFDLISTIGQTILTKHLQLKYDALTYYNNVTKQLIWTLFYWFYNVFPYKNFPWKDENMLLIEDMFKQVSIILELEEPYTFKFNHQRRTKFRCPDLTVQPGF